MVDVESLTDAELRTKLIEYGFPVMPITGTTRKVMAKKLKFLMENKSKINSENRRSLARYSSEEESDVDVKATKKDKNRRATMAAPPTRVPVRKTARKPDNDDSEPHYVVTEEKKVSTRSLKVTKAAEQDFDTGSDSESEIALSEFKPSSSTNNYNSKKDHPVSSSTPSSKFSDIGTAQFSPLKTFDSSFGRNVSYMSQSPSRYSSFGTSADVASDRLNQIRSRLSLGNSHYDKPSSLLTEQMDEKVETPFLSNFTRRLSQLSSATNSPQKQEYEYKNDIIKEHDTNGAGSYSTKTYLSRPFRPTKRDFTKDYEAGKENNIKNNLVSFTVIALAFLFFVVLAILYMGMHDGHTALDHSRTGLTIPYCDKQSYNAKRGINCILDTDLQAAIDMNKVLQPELLKKAIAHRCADSKIKPYMTEKEIVTFVKKNYGLQDEEEIKENLYNMEILSFMNSAWKISLLQIDDDVYNENALETMDDVIERRKSSTVALSMLNPDVPWKCNLYNKIATILQTIFVLGVGFCSLYFGNIGYKYFKHYRQVQKDELFYMVERIIDTLQTSASEDGDNFLVINHVRDMILPLNDRKRMEKTWQKALKFINENESRVRTELQIVQGEPYEVWRWLGTPNLNTTGSLKNKSWQGQAFETQVGSVNSLPCSPTPCLKIRGMVDDGDRNLHTIKEAVLSKCAHQCRILHCAVDTNSKCVYLKCADQNDAAIAYRNLHGWWYAGNLVTVKYLRLERYMQRYQDSPVSGPPYLIALQPATDWTN